MMRRGQVQFCFWRQEAEVLTQNMVGSARDRRSRIDPLYGPGRQPFELLDQQRIMRAGQHDAIRAAFAVSDEGRRDLT